MSQPTRRWSLRPGLRGQRGIGTDATSGRDVKLMEVQQHATFSKVARVIAAIISTMKLLQVFTISAEFISPAITVHKKISRTPSVKQSRPHN